ncbi:MAG: FAD-binding oxidoreductase [Deltaproteobacteria bacterium]|nr:FAD-binding oxidoreductase [Deltaproteobacteria bacterium]
MTLKYPSLDWDHTIESWGKYPKSKSIVCSLGSRKQEFSQSVQGVEPELSYLAYGRGRSYGDSCLNDGNVLLSTEKLSRFISLDAQTGILKVEAGLTLKEVLDHIVPQGWFLPVVPGTQFVTIGGAIANDIHGKNHHVAGTFGCHVKSLELLRSDGSRRVCSLTQNQDWFKATVGGLGLTGIIIWAEIQLKKIACPWISRETLRFSHLDRFFEYTLDSDSKFEYTVGWMDCLSQGAQLGRGVFFRGNHLLLKDVSEIKVKSDKIKTFPFNAPEFVLNRFSMKVFNTVYYHTHPSKKAELVHYRPFFFPLDGINHWNRLYGKRGFFQYQCVVPFEGTQSPIYDIIETFARSGLGSFLTVIKTFGQKPSPGLLSFPRPGVTLTLDVPNEGKKTLRVLERLDEKVVEAGGRVYPAKDARMSKESFQNYFPERAEFEKFKDPHFSSSFWRRVT